MTVCIVSMARALVLPPLPKRFQRSAIMRLMDGVYAAADIGSNTIHMLVADVREGRVRRMLNESHWLSLGEVVGRTGRIPDELAEELVAKVREFAKDATSSGAQRLYLFATEAIRAAENKNAILKSIEKLANVTVDVIPARREAELAWHGVQLDATGAAPTLLVEVGGGSAQVALCERDLVVDESSLSLGTGRLIAANDLTYPCEPKSLTQLEKEVISKVESLTGLDGAMRVVASGGVVRGIWKALHPDGEKTIRLNELNYLADVLPNLSAATITTRFGVGMNRALTLLPGSLVYKAVLERFGHQELTVSQFGVREGALLEMARGRI